MTLSLTNCPTCGSTVRVVSSDEGTSYYEPDDPRLLDPDRLTDALLVSGDHRLTLGEARRKAIRIVESYGWTVAAPLGSRK